MNRRQVPIGNTLYHVTNRCNQEGILLNGIIPHKSEGACYTDELGDENRYGVYLTSDYEALISIDSSFGCMPRHSILVLTVYVGDIKEQLIPDDAFDMSVDDLFTEKDIQEGLYDQFSYRYAGVIEPYRITGQHLLV